MHHARTAVSVQLWALALGAAALFLLGVRARYSFTLYLALSNAAGSRWVLRVMQPAHAHRQTVNPCL